MALHEIGYLIIGTTLQCWFSNTASDICSLSAKTNPPGIIGVKASDFETREVHYEERGLAVFDLKDDRLELRKKNDEKIYVTLSDLNSQTKVTPPASVEEEKQNQMPWRYESLDDILKGAMIGHEDDFLSQMRKDDLKTPIVISNEQIENIRMDRIHRLLNSNEKSLPIGYILTSVPCTYKKSDTNLVTGSCARPGQAPAYVKPDRNSEKVLEASLLAAQFEGHLLPSHEINPKEKSEKLFVFDEQGDWIRMKLVVLEKSKRAVWVNKKDVPYKLVHLKSSDRMRAQIEFLDSPGAALPEEDRVLANTLKVLYEEPPKLDLDSAGEAKWSGGILWVKVHLRSQPHCSSEEAKAVLTGWLPYINPKTKKKVLKWYPRGC